ncbi:MAG: LacI family transcriptional regulator [Clostridia bacterium]|nr:LacI family transcriptional regulator [Clostridia bacterium]
MRAGVSVSTVSRALNNSGGVSSETKRKVLEIADLNGYITIKKHSSLYLGVILPKNPYYFWKEALKGIYDSLGNDKDKDNINICIRFYSEIMYEKDYEKDILHCFDDFDEDIQCIIIVPPNLPSVIKILDDISEKIPIFFLNEKVDIKNSAYVGIDAYNDGAAFALSCLSVYPENPHLLIINSENQYMSNMRKKGFCDKFLKLMPDADIVGEIKLNSVKQNTISSNLARSISKDYNDRFNVVFVAQGMLPQVCSALYKLNLHNKVICLGCENPEQNKKYIECKLIKGVLIQDIYRQGYECMQLAKAYLKTGNFPSGANIYINSKIHIPQER